MTIVYDYFSKEQKSISNYPWLYLINGSLYRASYESVAHQLETSIIYCYFNEQEIPCDEIFKSVWTNYGK